MVVLPNRRKVFRGGGGLSPLQLSVPALQYLRAEKLAELGGANGSAVASWPDEAGSYTASNGTPSQRPVLYLNLYGGRAGVRFGGGSHSLIHTGVASKACWAVIKPTTYRPDISYLCGSSGTGGFWVDVEGASPKWGPGWYGGGATQRAANAANRIAAGSLNTVLWTADRVYINGTEVTGYVHTSTISGATITILGISSHFPQFWSFDLVELAHFSGTPSGADVTGLQAHARTKYGAP